MRCSLLAVLGLTGSVALAACAPAASSSAPLGEAGAADSAALPDPSGSSTDAGSAEGSADASVDKAATCVATFGQAIGAVGFARFDGTVVAVLAPGNQSCTAPNRTHLVLELSFSGAVYRMVANVDDTASVGTIRMHTLTHPMVGGPWSDGWHAAPLDYVATLGLHQTDFAPVPTAAAVAAVTDALALGAHVSVFATAQGEANSAHLIHRQGASNDGAVVVDVDATSPTWLLFSFSDQNF